MDGLKDNPIDFLMGLTKEVSGVLKELENDLPETVQRVERQVKIIGSWLVRLDGEKDLPPELHSVLTEVKQSVENVKNTLIDWGNRHSRLPKWTKYMGASKQFITGFAPAVAISIAMMPFGPFILIALVALVVLFLWKNAHITRQLQDAWNADLSLQQFREMEQDLKENAKQLRHFVNLKMQIKKERKYDISKVLAKEEKAMAFWCLHFGSQTSSVATDRFIQALVGEHAAFERARKDAQTAWISVIRDVIDANNDGEVSPQEFLSFLQFFGPLEASVDKVVKSVLDFGTSPPSRFPWFIWKKLDRRLVEESCPKQGVGTFLIRCSSLPGEFALSYVRADKKVTHIKILNSPEGFHFSGNEKRFSDLSELVMVNRDILQREYVDPTQRVVFNISGRKFETTTGPFVSQPDTLLGKLVGAGQHADREEIFLDRDPDAFQVILNWYRHNDLFIPQHVPRDLLRAELAWFEIPLELPVEAAPAAAPAPAPTVAAPAYAAPAPVAAPAAVSPLLAYDNNPSVRDSGNIRLSGNDTPLTASASSNPSLTASDSAVAPVQAAAAPSPAPAAAHAAEAHHEHPSLSAVHKPSEAIITPGAAPVARLHEDKSYFHGLITDQVAAELLAGRPAGSYLARNSKSNPANCIIISYIDGKGKLVNFRLWRAGPGRFSLMQNPQPGTQTFDSLQSFVNAYPEQLQLPVERSSQTAYDVVD